MANLQITFRSPLALAPHPKNARQHSPKQIDQIAASIASFGFNVPVLVDKTGQILAGHGRVQAAIQLGLTEVPTIAIEHLTETQRRAFMLADNRIAELSTWDEQQLAIELEELSSVDEPFEITDTGFDLARVDVLIEELHKPVTKSDPADLPVDPLTVESVARLGDLWLLGRHRLFVGSALDRLSYEVLLGRDRAQMVFIDPPYNVRIQGNVSGLGKARHSEFVMASGEMSSLEFEAFLHAAFARLVAASEDGSIRCCHVWTAPCDQG